MIAIVDYGMGNVKSVFNALDYLGEEVEITSNQQKLQDASHIILPGVGAFGKAIETLHQRNLVETLNKEVIDKGKPFLGICLGMQLVAKTSFEYGEHQGFGWIDGEVRRLELEQSNLKLPHMGWNDITLVKDNHPIFDGLVSNQSSFYFVHTYHMVLNDNSVLAATCDYGGLITSVIIKDNIVATQFHPEKSQDNGIQILDNFINWNP